MAASLRLTLLALLFAALLGCSPEARRTQGGGRGADVGNRPASSEAVEIHGPTNPSYDTPINQVAVEGTEE